MRRAFVASASLKPMAQQLIQDRTPAAYNGVETYARAHSATDSGALAWLVVGYAHILDHDYTSAIPPLNRAKLHAGDLGDYVTYYLATAYLETGKAAEAVAAIGDFDKDFPASLLVRDADVLNATALLADNRPSEAIASLETRREPVRSDLELALGRAYEATNQPQKAAAIFRNIYFEMPLSTEAPAAEAELNKIQASASLPALTLVQRQTRADLLYKGKRYSDAADAYRNLLTDADENRRASIELTLADALRKSGQNREARAVLDSLSPSTPDLVGQRLFEFGELARASDDDDAFLGYLDQLRQTAPTSNWLEQSLLSAGNIYLLRKDYDHAIDSFRELQARFPNADRAAYAHWKVAWLSLRMGRNAEAKKGFEDQIALYPDSSEIPAALYWRGRLAEEDRDTGLARAYYLKTSARYRNYYYGELARQRIAQMPAEPPATQVTLLDRIPPLKYAPESAGSPPADNLRVQKAQLLENGALLDFAVRELKAAGQEEPGNWPPAEIARMYRDAGRYDLAIQTLKRAQPNYFAVDIPALPRSYWEALFPKAYWLDLKRFSDSNGLDPYLVASLIRQESEFNPNAVSKKDAVGLMQLLPRVGRTVAREEKLRHFSANELFSPGTNLQIGTRYFKSMIDKFGSVEYALAAYNAGTDRVEDWLSQPKYRDVPEFVESIPFTETREYVEAIVRNAYVYRQLYGTP
jgi:soluble lytic murein transglycosylase